MTDELSPSDTHLGIVPDSDLIRRADAVAAIEAIPPEWARKGSMARFNQVTIGIAVDTINALASKND